MSTSNNGSSNKNYVPPYSYFYNNGRNPYSDGKMLPIAATRRPNPLWRNYGVGGIVLGVGLLTLGLSIIPLEISRIVAGSLNRGTLGSYLLYPNYNYAKNGAEQQIKFFVQDVYRGNNVDLAGSGIIPHNSVGSPLTGAPNNYPVQDKYVWPWSHAALLFSLVTIAAGVVGILSGCRRTYTSLYAFFILSLMSGFLSIFLVTYFVVLVYWENERNGSRKDQISYYRLDYALGVVLLTFSLLTLFLSFFAAAFAGLSAGVCLGPKSPLVRLSDMNTCNNSSSKNNKKSSVSSKSSNNMPRYF